MACINDECPVHLLCPTCNPMAGCQHIGCPCYNGNVLYRPARNPPNLPRPLGCPACVQECIRSDIKCPATSCCKGTEVNYVADDFFSDYYFPFFDASTSF